MQIGCERNNCEWDFVNSRVRINNGIWIDLVGKYHESCRRVYASQDIIVPAQQQVIVPARSTLANPRKTPPTTILETQKLRDGLLIGRTLIPSQHDKAQVCIANISKVPQLVTEGTCLGNLRSAHAIEAVESVEEEKTESVDGSVINELMGNLPDELTAEQRTNVRNLLVKYDDIFSKHEYDIGRTHLVEYHIDTGSSRPIRQPLRRQPLKHLDAIDENVSSMLEHGIIEPAASPWASNVVIVAKKDGSLRFCVDYRAINSVTYKDSYPLPLIDNCLNAMSGASWFSTLDLRAGYHNIPVAEKDRDKTAFITRRGCWRYTVMPFGVTCAPSVFQRLMDLVLAGLSYEYCLVYLDDIIIYARTFDEHLRRLEAVFSRLRWARLKLKPSKCSLLQRKVSFLGHNVSEAGVEMQSEKIKAVLDWPTPKNLHDVRSYLGLCGYYRRFISGFANVAAPLHALTAKGVRFEWKWEHQQAFEQLKTCLTTAPVLAMPNNEDPYILDTDASDIGLGAVLSQVQNGVERVIAYASRTLQKPERNYETTRKELLAVVYGLKQFRQYLLGRPITIRVDHAALSWLRRTAEPLPQLARWLTLIEQYDYTVVHRPGKRHSNADALSRRGEAAEEVEGERQVYRSSAIQVEKDGNDSDLLAGENLAKAQQEDPEIGPIVKCRLEKESQPPIDDFLAESEETKMLWSQWNQLFVRNGIVYRKYSSKNGKQNYSQLLIPSCLKTEAIRRCHTGMTGGHLGTKKTIDQIQRRFFWVKWRADVGRYCRRCPECCSYHRGKLPRSGLLQPIIAGAPFERLSIDLTGPHCKSDRGNIWIMTCADPFTKWVEAFPLRNKEAETVAKVLVEQVFTRFGVPIALLSDNGKEVDSGIMRAVCRLLEIDKLHTTSYKASTNAAVERFHKTMNTMLGKVVSENQKDWDTRLPFVMAAYRASRHESTGYSPNLLTLGREVRAPVDIVMDLPNPDGPSDNYDNYVEKLQTRMKDSYRLVREQIGRSAERNKRYYDLRVRSRKYNIGDWVYYYNPRTYRGRQDKWSRKFSGPYLVIDVTSPVNVTLQRSRKSKSFIVHIDKVKPYLSETPKSWIGIEKSTDDSQLEPMNEDESAVLENDESVSNCSEDHDEIDMEVEQQPLLPVTPSPVHLDAADKTELNNADDYAVDQGPQPRPKRVINLPIRFR